MTSARDHDLPAAADARLDALLCQWAATNALPPIQAAAIRERVLAEAGAPEAALTFEWWQSLAASISQSVARPATALRSLGWGMGYALAGMPR